MEFLKQDVDLSEENISRLLDAGFIWCRKLAVSKT